VRVVDGEHVEVGDLRADAHLVADRRIVERVKADQSKGRYLLSASRLGVTPPTAPSVGSKFEIRPLCRFNGPDLTVDVHLRGPPE
jgi:hypothetical protein